MPIAAILFDLDETLMPDESVATEALLTACELARERHGIDPQALQRSVREHARQLWHASPTIDYCRAIGISSWEGLWGRFEGDDPNLRALREWAPTYRRESWAQALAEHGANDPALAELLAARFQEERRARRIVFSDARPALEDLRQTYRLALLTNGPPDLQREKIEGADLARYFEVITISGEEGVGKPDERIFALTLERLAVPPQAAVMVGNSLSRDIAGAQRAGVKAIWVNRTGVGLAEGLRPDAEVQDLSRLRDVISAL
jgi:putative hydrolase of the HAD superfamily